MLLDHHGEALLSSPHTTLAILAILAHLTITRT